MSDKILDRLAKLFALARNNPNANEARAALLMAQRLMAEHAVTEDAIANHAERAEVRDTINADFASEDDDGRVRKDPFAIRLACVIGDYFRVKAFTRNARVLFAGYGNDQKVARLVYRFALDTMETQAAGYIVAWKCLRDTPPSVGESRTERQTWLDGFVVGLREGFAAQLKANPQWLAHARMPVEVVQWIDTNLKLRTTYTHSKTSAVSGAREHGAKHGREFAAANGGSARKGITGLLK